MRVLVVSLMCLASPVAAADLSFCWIGNGGYTMTGKMSLTPDAMSKTIVTETDVIAFKIAGYHNGRLIGTWDAREAEPHSTWHLRFDPERMTFLTGKSFPTVASQGWNADGAVRNCGAQGFGFNAGDYAQDVCVNGTYVAESSIAPDTPFYATTGHLSPDCGAAHFSSKARAH